MPVYWDESMAKLLLQHTPTVHVQPPEDVHVIAQCSHTTVAAEKNKRITKTINKACVPICSVERNHQ